MKSVDPADSSSAAWCLRGTIAVYLWFILAFVRWNETYWRMNIMRSQGQTLPIAGLLATILVAAYMVVQLHGQGGAIAESVDLRNAATAELRDAQGQVVLTGSFMLEDEDDAEDVERKASLQSSSTGTQASGVAEVEFAREKPVEQEVEFTGRNLQAGARYTLVVDGHDVLAGVAERNGTIELERNVPIPGAALTK